MAAAASVEAAIEAAAAIPIVTAAGGAVLASDGLVFAHASETIFPARYSRLMDQMSARPSVMPVDPASEGPGAQGGDHFHFNLSVTDSTGFERLLRNNARVLTKVLREQTRDYDANTNQRRR